MTADFLYTCPLPAYQDAGIGAYTAGDEGLPAKLFTLTATARWTLAGGTGGFVTTWLGGLGGG